MKFKLGTFLPELLRQVEQARESLAQEHLGPEKIREVVFKAAQGGHRQIRIRLPDGVDLKGAAATKVFERWAKESGLTLSWENRSCSMPDGRVVVIWEPEITW